MTVMDLSYQETVKNIILKNHLSHQETGKKYQRTIFSHQEIIEKTILKNQFSHQETVQETDPQEQANQTEETTEGSGTFKEEVLHIISFLGFWKICINRFHIKPKKSQCCVGMITSWGCSAATCISKNVTTGVVDSSSLRAGI